MIEEQNIKVLAKELERLGSSEKNGDLPKDDMYSCLLENSDINRIPRTDWRYALNACYVSKIEPIFRAIVILERDGDWTGGSVASSVWIFEMLKERVSERKEIELADWALRNRGKNPYTPFGHKTYASSLASYREEQAEKDRRRRNEDAKSRKDQVEADRRRRQRQQAHEQRKEQSAARSQDLRYAWYELMAQTSEERLKNVAHGSMPLEMIGADWINIELLSYADENTLRALIRRIDRRKKNPWRRVKRLAQAELDARSQEK